jgi:hypothetical protein
MPVDNSYWPEIKSLVSLITKRITLQMKRIFSLIAILTLISLGSCEDLALHSIILDNQSDYNVTVELYTGTTNEDGSMFFENYSVSADSKETVKSEVNVVYVDSYTPTDNVQMNIDGSKITFTNL